MEYLVGSITTLAIVLVAGVVFKRTIKKDLRSIAFSQSYVHSMVYPYMLTNSEIKDSKPSQASKHLGSLFVRIVVVDGFAYWIKDNIFYMAEMEGEDVLKETAKQVDTMAMDKVQLNKMLFIVEKLTEGTINDSRNAG